MKKNKILSAILSFLLIFTMFSPLPASYGDNSPEKEGMVVDKRVVSNGDGTYSIELEAYGTGESVVTEITIDVPTDIVLVLDQSGSMDYNMTGYTFGAYTGNNRRNSNLYGLRHNGGSGNLWYKLDDDSYVSVSVVQELPATYSAISSNETNNYYYSNSSNIYHLKNDVYHKVTVIRSGVIGNRRYTYTSDGGLNVTSNGSYSRPNFGGEGPLYLRSENLNEAVYTYSYTDEHNQTVILGSSTGQNTNFTAVTLYQRIAGNIKRLAALKSALTSFVNQVNERVKGEDGNLGTADDVNHRIAVVGFASGYVTGYNPQNYENTEILIGSSEYRYGSSARGVYGSAFQDMNTASGRNNIAASIDKLAAEGATRTDLGMEMANGILNAYPLSSGEERNRVVIVFTDGVPTTSNTYSSTVANAAIAYGATAKTTYGATVYTIGIFDGADATSAGNPNGTETQKANWFMQNLSSNGGTVQSPSYYLSASDAEGLSSIFKQIADQIESGGSSTELTEETVIKDIISPYFTLPPGTQASDITLKTWSCTGIDGNDEYTWSENPTASGAVAQVNGDQVSVTGFDFSENWVGTVTDEEGNVTYRGSKLVIQFDVKAKDKFIGGNQVPTNSLAGVYKDAEATKPLFEFPKPLVDVPLLPFTISIPDEEWGSYLYGTIPPEAIELGATVTIGTYPNDFTLDLDPNAENYGLEAWQNAFVDISTETSTSGSFDDVTEDVNFTLTVTVSPTLTGSIEEEGVSETGTGTILLFTPKLTFKDSDVYYGDIAEYGSGNYLASAATWIHKSGGTEIDHKNVNMLNDEPGLNFGYGALFGLDVDDTVITKEDIPIAVEVLIGEGDATSHTTFIHQPCDPNCGWTNPTTPGEPAFLLHVKTVKLNVVKINGDADEAFLVKVLRNGQPYTELSIPGGQALTIEELPVGTYELVEDLDWSWRYTVTYHPTESDGKVILSPGNTEDTLTLENNKKTDKWLNDYSCETNTKGGN